MKSKFEFIVIAKTSHECWKQGNYLAYGKIKGVIKLQWGREDVQWSCDCPKPLENIRRNLTTNLENGMAYKVKKWEFLVQGVWDDLERTSTRCYPTHAKKLVGDIWTKTWLCYRVFGRTRKLNLWLFIFYVVRANMVSRHHGCHLIVGSW